MPVIDQAESAIFLFAWVEEGTAWSEDLARCDEDVYAFTITHQENECATLQLDVDNPRIGLLAAGRNVWGWLTHRKPNGDLQALFYGRLVGLPEDLQDEIVRLQFRAKPTDYEDQKAALAATLRELPWYDPAFMAEGADQDPDNVLETRTASWHCHRITHEVSISDIGQGEDGTITLTEDDHFYDALKIDVGQTPLQAVQLDAAVTWTQSGAGTVDLTATIYNAFAGTGCPYQFPLVGSFTSDGLLGNWPKAGSSIGAGWKMAEDAIAETVAWQKPASKKVRYVEKPVEVPTAYQVTTDPKKLGDLSTNTLFNQWLNRKNLTLPKPEMLLTPAEEAAMGWKNWDVLFEIGPIAQHFPVFYQTSRARTERVSFRLSAGLQPVLEDPEGADFLALSLSSSTISAPIDPGGGSPLFALSSNSYFPTDRGQLSLQYLMLLARAHIYVRARGVSVTVEPVWESVDLDQLSCRANLVIDDPRMPGGQVAGKITAYTISSDAAGQPLHLSITIGCMLGTAEVLEDVDPPEDSYAEDYSDNYDELLPGGAVPVIAGELRYQAFDGAQVIDDDGLDLLNMTPGRVVQSLTITNGISDQEAAINASKADPVAGLRAAPTQVSLTLVPLTGQSFETDYAVTVEPLFLPKSVDLAAPSL